MFDGARLKIERANHHIGDVERQWTTFRTIRTHQVVKESSADLTVHTFSMQFVNEFPRNIALCIGDAIHNLRTALDHMTWETIGREGGTQDRHLKFPFGENRISFEAFCKGMKTRLPETRTVFKSLEAFPGGKGHFLYALNCLDNVDKHSVLTPLLQVSNIKSLTLRNRDGSIRKVLDYSAELGFVAGERLTVETFPEPTSIDFDDDVEISPDIIFGDVDFVGYQPIVPTLRQLSQAAIECINNVEWAII